MRLFENCPRCNIHQPLDPSFDGRGKCGRCHHHWQRRRRGDAMLSSTARHARDGKAGYRMTRSEYAAMWAAQEGKCAICGSTKPGCNFKRLVVDHCHKTGEIRGLLCGTCNAGLGMLRDCPEQVSKALKYLKKGPDVRP